MQRRKKLIVANWKLNPPTLIEARSIAGKITRTAARMKRSQTVICPSFLHLAPLASRSRNTVMFGSQDVSSKESGAFTGEVSAKQVRDAGAGFTIIGHSERRKSGDTDKSISEKLEASLGAGLIAILCFGEAQRDREGNFFEEIKNQLLSSLGHVRSGVFHKSLVLAYEPVWEIGRVGSSGMKPSDVNETAIFVRKIINDAFGIEAGQAVPILYGGSVSPDSARAIVYEGGVDGLLVGRQSLDANAFSVIQKQIELGDAGH